MELDSEEGVEVVPVDWSALAGGDTTGALHAQALPAGVRLGRDGLGIEPHPEWSWWAIRGQLIDLPGYLANYALSAIVCGGPVKIGPFGSNLNFGGVFLFAASMNGSTT